MHFSVVCSEDVPRMRPAARTASDFGSTSAELYAKVCSGWPRGEVPDAFYSIPAASSATLLLSGGIDPVTPPRHGERVAKALGSKAKHVVVSNAGHGVMALECMRDVLFRFVDADTDAQALALDATCASRVPYPPPFAPFGVEPRP
jgi:hypothetical protein